MSSSKVKQSIQIEFLEGLNGDLLVGSRALAFSSAAASLAIIMLIAQISPLNERLEWSQNLSALAFPIWLSLGLSYDLWVQLNLDHKQLHSLKWLPKLQAACFYITGLISMISIALLAYTTSSKSVYFFGAACIIGVALVAYALWMAAKISARRIIIERLQKENF